MMLILAIVLAVVLAVVEWRRWPLRKVEVAKARELEADANDALKSISRLARTRAKSKAIPIPIMGPEDTTDVIALRPHRRVGDGPVEHQHRRHLTPSPSQYRIVAASKRGK